ncbi:DNA helicase IV [Vibrio ulleungensis]|uniref:DNA 3'-5' helicase n=1 Tax=Vibrio ulleungensis TaxID=2807619 RepID=A0ABS2HFA5_9VIBR|nr:DNA helicase IV [Vibrio ulleungensis]MBM7035754.1 DNA helicase IV [Vibrio ulleungensis]
MQIQATPLAQFFIHSEFASVAVKADQFELASNTQSVILPFTHLCGKITVKRGVRWAQLSILGLESDGRQEVWTICGLDWNEAQKFAEKSTLCYEKWHRIQCRKLGLYLPKWHDSLNQIIKLPAYVKQSRLNHWREMIGEDLTEIGYGMKEATQRMPTGVSPLLPWQQSDELLNKRNQNWLDIELENWHVFFSQIERAPLNHSQQVAVLIDEDNTLVLAGAGTGKTSVITAKIAYLLQSHQLQAENMVVLAFGNEASKEMRRRLDSRIGSSAINVRVNTFHKLAMHIVHTVENQAPSFSSIATNLKQKQAWCSQWLREHWGNPAHFRRWQKHLSQWPIAYLSGDEALIEQVENPRLIAWLEQQVSGLSGENLDKKSIQQQLIDHTDYSRLNSELQLCWPAYVAWKKYLNAQGEYDFDSMIIKATQYLNKGKFKGDWQFLAVDEFQDISPMRLAFLESLKLNNPDMSLFAVGDDWQSIYRFSGSDIALTTQFSNRFYPAKIHHLDRSYRCNSQIAAVAERFIGQNPSQLAKSIVAQRSADEASVTVFSQSHLFARLKKLDDSLTHTHSVLVLGRNHRHQPADVKEWSSTFQHLEFQFMTCHASKGQESDYVVVVGVNNNEFPAKERTSHLVEALRDRDEGIEHAEERRLMYTAMTRAKEHVFICYDAAASTFIDELSDYEGVNLA